MKRPILFLAMMLAAAVTAVAGVYKPAEVPNVHTLDRTRFTSDPDGTLSAAAIARMDSAMARVRRESTAEMAVVMVDDIADPDNIDDYATELFGLWGLGKKDRDNGVLVLVVKDRRKAAIRTGYGAEGVLPDIVCGTILREQMYPAFREGDYDGGLTAATETIAELLTDPDAAAELQSRLRDADETAGNSEGEEIFHAYLFVAALLAAGMLAVLAMKCVKLRGRSRFDKYKALEQLKPVYLILGFVTIGMGMVAAIILVALMQHWRNGRRACPNCGTPMRKVDEVHDNDYLTPAQDMEERIGSVDYDVWLCPQCGETDILPYVNRASTMRECEACHARAARLSADRVLRRPTVGREGTGMKEYTCLNCRHITRVPYTIAKTPPVVVVPMGGGGSRGGGFGGGSFGGGFGGGMTGGGGASGGW